MARLLSFAEAIREGTELCLAEDPSVYVMGLGATDPKGIFGTTQGLDPTRVFDMPVSENGMTGIAIGSALVGQRPILTHQRLDFMLLSLDQVINNAAKWHYMFGGSASVPLVIRILIGRGWGQGPQHAQSLHALFAQIPGLKVLLPATAYDAKGMLIAAVRDPNPVIILEHRWLYNTTGAVPEEAYETPFSARIAREGANLTIASSSYMLLESLHASEILAEQGIEAEVIDLRTLSPFDDQSLLNSVAKTGHLVVVDGASQTGSFAGEIITRVIERGWDLLKAPPKRICFPDTPTPTSWVLAKGYYPQASHIAEAAGELLKQPVSAPALAGRGDIPDPSFTGPF